MRARRQVPPVADLGIGAITAANPVSLEGEVGLGPDGEVTRVVAFGEASPGADLDVGVVARPGVRFLL